jgi:hypothetical protein
MQDIKSKVYHPHPTYRENHNCEQRRITNHIRKTIKHRKAKRRKETTRSQTLEPLNTNVPILLQHFKPLLSLGPPIHNPLDQLFILFRQLVVSTAPDVRTDFLDWVSADMDMESIRRRDGRKTKDLGKSRGRERRRAIRNGYIFELTIPPLTGLP